MIKAVYNRDRCPNSITVTPRYLSELIASTFLDKKLPEITLSASATSFELKSYIDELRCMNCAVLLTWVSC